MEKKKSIEDAFKEAQGKGAATDGLADKVVELFKRDFPHTMAAFEMTFGHEKGTKIMMLMLADSDIVALCNCFFMTGYHSRMREEKEGGPDNA